MDASGSEQESPWLAKAMRDLGWREVLARIAEHAVNEKTVASLLLRRPLEDRSEAEREQAWVAEAMHLRQSDAPLPVRRTADLEDTVLTVRRGATASGVQLRDCALCLEQGLRLRAHVTHHEDACPTLAAALLVAVDLDGLARLLRATLDEQGELFDSASDGLRVARHELARARDALRQEQTQLLRKHRDQLAGAYFAEREGRFVLPVRADAARVEGTVLGSSSTGSTLYVEPRELTEKNNRMRLAEARVHQEEAKVLAELSAKVRARIDDLAFADEACLLADRVAAAANWGVRHEAVPVHFAPEPVLELIQVRHPLLLSATHTADNSPVVANDLKLSPGQALIISGPNAGGKTVSLKCLGLAAWLARSGLPVPCAPSSKIGWFSQVFTDIGDDQSISRSLSTFAAHVQNLAHCVQHAGRGTLLLLDEVAGGTDPDEGAALAVAVLHALVNAGASVATTTHYDRLKQLGASGSDQFNNASVGFDMDAMRPTFRVTLGIPGASSALAVAQRYGIPEAVVEHARACLPQEQQAQQRLLTQLEDERERAGSLRQAHEEMLAKTERQRDAFEREREHALRADRLAIEKLSADLTREVQQARLELRQAKALIAGSSRDLLREAEQLVSSAAMPITVDGNLTRTLKGPASAAGAAPAPSQLVVGTVVRLVHLNTDASVVEAPSKGQVRVAVGGLKMSVPLDKIRLQTARKPVAPKAARRTKSSSAAVSEPEPMRTTLNTCDLRGVRVDEGLSQVDQFLDQMIQLHESTAFILHGHGTGAMKSAVRQHLGGSNVVRRYEPASREDGGDAFTVVWLF